MAATDESSTPAKALKVKFVGEAEFRSKTSELRNRVFSECHTLSHSALYSDEQMIQSEPNRVRFDQLESLYCLLMLDEECIGWHFGFQDGPLSYYMCNSAILPEHQRNGYYTFLAQQVMDEVQSRGYLKITSMHHPTNTAVLIAKLKMGFIVSGMKLSANFGTLLELEWNASSEVNDVMKIRCGAKKLGAGTIHSVT
jgi:ribosomal protein S18 acetylase RimI-like enzyme